MGRMRTLSLLGLALALACSETSAPERRDEAPASATDSDEARADEARPDEAPSPPEAHRAGWGVAYRRASWTLCEAPLERGAALEFERTRFEPATGRLLGFTEDPAPLAALGERALVAKPEGWGLADGPTIETVLEAAAPFGAHLATLESRYVAAHRALDLVLRDPATLEERARERLVARAGSDALGLAADGSALVVALPTDCREGDCEPARLERWTGDLLRAPERAVLAEGFDDVALEATGRAALLTRWAHRQVFVVDARTGERRWTVTGYGPRPEGCTDPDETAWPQGLALAPGGDAAALVETDQDRASGGVRVRLVEREGESSRDGWEGPLDHVGPIAFAGDGEGLTLLVAGEGFFALRRGVDRPPPRLSYEAPSLPRGWRELARRGGPGALPERSFVTADGADHVRVRAIERSELAGVPAERRAAVLFRRLVGVPPAALDEPDRALSRWEAEGAWHAELIVPACHEGVSNADAYHRLRVDDEAILHVALMVPPGTPPREVEARLALFVDGPLGAPPVPRTLPVLPERDCGI